MRPRSDDTPKLRRARGDLPAVRRAEKAIQRAKTDDALYRLLSRELKQRLPPRDESLRAHAARIARLPRGLRAMAATYQLDVSLALDDLAFHFVNWHSKAFARETARGLRELGAREAAAAFAAAYRSVLPHWDRLRHGVPGWYWGSRLERRLDQLTSRMWRVAGRSREYGLMSYWIDYARRNPGRIVE